MDLDNRLMIIAFLNAWAFFFFAWDKLAARWKRRRIPEGAMLLLTFIGGGIGAVLAMVVVRHKTRKRSFLWKFYLCFLFGIALNVLLLRA